MIRRAVTVLVLAALLWLPAEAVDLDAAFGTDSVTAAVPDGARAALEGITPGTDLDRGLGRLWSFVTARLNGLLREILRPLAAIIAITVLCSIGESAEACGRVGLHAVPLGGCLAIAAIGISDVQSVLTVGSEALAELIDFSRVLLPVLTTAAAAGGQAGSAAAVYTASALFSDLLLTAGQQLVLPMICAFTAAGTASAALGEQRLDGLVHFLEWAAKSLLKLLVTAFTLYLSLTGVLAAAADKAAVNAAKGVLTAALPVVGKLLAGASEALVAGAGLVRGAVGAYGLLVCLAAVLLPALRLGLRCLLFRAAAALCSGIGGPRETRLIALLGKSYGMLLGLVGSGAAIEFLAVISMIRMVTA